MALRTRTLTFTLDPSFRGSCKLTLGFVPTGQETFRSVHPVAWRVLEMNEGGPQTVPWTNNLAGCRASVLNNIVTAQEYIAVPPGHSTNLVLDNSQPSMPVYSFTSPPTPFDGFGNTRSRIGNMTGTNIGQFATGFIVANGFEERMNAVLVTDPVSDGGSVFIDYLPQLRVWANLDYKESELLNSTVANHPIVWQTDFSQINRSRINITIRREGSGRIVGTIQENHRLFRSLSSDSDVVSDDVKGVYATTGDDLRGEDDAETAE